MKIRKFHCMGDIKGNSYKDLKLSFKDVDLNKITPAE